jgi:stage III sporulation protein AG
MQMIDKFKDMMMHKGYKKIIYNFLILIIICTIGLIVWDTFSKKPIKNGMDTDSKEQEKEAKYEEIEKGKNYNHNSQMQLKHILSQIKGVGEVEVMITYESTAEVVPASNVTKSNQITEEKDSQGGSRTTTQEERSENVVTKNETNDLMVIKEIKPKVKGVVIVAEGAGDIQVKMQLIEAAKTIFQIPSFKVMVYEKQ